MPRAKNGQAVRPIRRTPKAQRNLRNFLDRALKEGDLGTWRRTKAVLGYVQGQSVYELAEALDVDRSSVSRWLRWYDDDNLPGLLTGKAPGAVPRLTLEQQDELVALIDAGPQLVGFPTGMWTGPMIGEMIQQRFGVRYHNHHIPRLLKSLRFSVQRPRKRLARADKEAQAVWERETFPAIKKKPRTARAQSCSRTKSASG
jgi:transposase